MRKGRAFCFYVNAICTDWLGWGLQGGIKMALPDQAFIADRADGDTLAVTSPSGCVADVQSRPVIAAEGLDRPAG
jgi:hypothetical protein